MTIKYKRRTQVDFSKHVHTVLEQELENGQSIRIDELKKPDCFSQSVRFTNTGGVCVVTGDYGNWILCREFHPSEEGYVSDGYWCEKLGMMSGQDPSEFSEEQAVSEINEYLNENDGDMDSDEIDFWERLRESGCESEYEFIAQAMNRPSSIVAKEQWMSFAISISIL